MILIAFISTLYMWLSSSHILLISLFLLILFVYKLSCSTATKCFCAESEQYHRASPYFQQSFYNSYFDFSLSYKECIKAVTGIQWRNHLLGRDYASSKVTSWILCYTKGKSSYGYFRHYFTYIHLFPHQELHLVAKMKQCVTLPVILSRQLSSVDPIASFTTSAHHGFT